MWVQSTETSLWPSSTWCVTGGIFGSINYPALVKAGSDGFLCSVRQDSLSVVLFPITNMKIDFFPLSKENSALKRLRNDLVKFHIILCRNLCCTISISWNWWIKLIDQLRESERNLSDSLTLNDYWTALKSRKKNELLIHSECWKKWAPETTGKCLNITPQCICEQQKPAKRKTARHYYHEW